MIDLLSHIKAAQPIDVQKLVDKAECTILAMIKSNPGLKSYSTYVTHDLQKSDYVNVINQVSKLNVEGKTQLLAVLVFPRGVKDYSNPLNAIDIKFYLKVPE